MNSSNLIIECDAVWKIFRTYQRQSGFKGILRNFFYREYVEFQALKNIHLKIHKGEFVGLIGTNGAGKTTFIKCITGIIPVSRGKATLFGSDSFYLSDSEKAKMSLVMGQRSQLWWDLPPIDSFKLLREIYQIPQAEFDKKIKMYSERLEVTDRLNIQLRQLSLGQRMKMEIIGAFLHNPEVVFLDEPTIGLDLVSQRTIRQFLSEINQQQEVTIVLTSHDMEDIEQTCERLIILDNGNILFDGDIVDLQRQLVGKRSIKIHLEENCEWNSVYEQELNHFAAIKTHSTADSLSFLIEATRVHAFVQYLLTHLKVRDLTIERESLEQLILEIFKTKQIQPKVS